MVSPVFGGWLCFSLLLVKRLVWVYLTVVIHVDDLYLGSGKSLEGRGAVSVWVMFSFRFASRRTLSAFCRIDRRGCVSMRSLVCGR